MTTLYKYRSLENLDRILDILLYERLYAANFKNLNDSMEGHYRYSTDVNKELRTQILDERNRTLICSLSKKKDIGLMWTHYANENKGCCIELQVTSPSWTMIEVDYKDKLPNITNVREILSVKGNVWSYEEEVRFIKTLNDNVTIHPYLEITISKVYIGCEVSPVNFNFYKKIFEGINKFKKKKGSIIEVVKMRKEDINYGFQ